MYVLVYVLGIHALSDCISAYVDAWGPPQCGRVASHVHLVTHENRFAHEYGDGD